MCGRYVQTKRARDRAKLLAMREAAAAPRPETWNLAPSTSSLVVRAKDDGLITDWLFWGYQESSTATVSPINARIESAASKILFKGAWKARRCVIPADGWYEWRQKSHGKQPYYFHSTNGEPLFFAGLWTGETFAILTTAADGELWHIHHRRPLALSLEHSREWIEETPRSEGSLVAKLVPAQEIAYHPVSGRVSSPRNDGPELIVESKELPVTQPEFDLFQNPE
jgi:putative SOS response-associated peptidase YedK